jgi:hypothetical protein
MNNLNNYFGLIIIGAQICRLDQVLDYVKPIHRRMKSYKWHLMISLIHGN